MAKRRQRIHNDIRTLRKERVARLRARGLSLRDIVAALGNPADPSIYMVNPRTGEPFNLTTIAHDIDAIRTEARERTRADVDEHRARQMEEINEMKRAAWAARDLKALGRAIELEMKLLGTAQAAELDVKSGGKPLGVQVVEVVKDHGSTGAG